MEVFQQNNQYIIKIPMDSVDASALEKLLRELRLQELLAQRKGTNEESDALAFDVTGVWWEQNKHRFLNENPDR